MNSISYRVYSDFGGWKLIGIEKKPLNVISLISNKMKIEQGTYLVIEHDHELDCDNPLKYIYNEEDLLELQSRLLDLPKENDKVLNKNDKVLNKNDKVLNKNYKVAIF